MIKNAKPHIAAIISILSLLCVFFLAVSFALAFVGAISPLFLGNDKQIFLELKQIFKPAIFTIKLSVLSTLLAVAIGLPAAFFTANKNFFGCKFMESLSSVPLCIPPLLVALGYVSAFGMQGVANQILVKIFNLEDSPITFLYSFGGIIFVQGFYNFPLVMKTVSDAWKRIPQNQKEAAQMLGASKFCIFRTVTIFQLLPSLASCAMLVFLFCFFSFIIVLMFGAAGSTTLEVEVYQAARSTLNFQKAACLALVETFIATLVVALQVKIEKQTSKNNGINISNNVENSIQSKSAKKIEKVLFLILSAVVVICFIFPFFMIAVNAFFNSGGRRGSSNYGSLTFINFVNIFSQKSFYDSLIHTIQTSVLTALICTITGCTYAFCIKQSKTQNVLLKMIPMLPMAVSSVVIGFGITQLVRQGSPLLLVLTQAALYWPFAFRQIMNGVDRIPQEIHEASIIYTKNRFVRFFSVIIPLCKTNIISAFGFCFALSAGDASLPLILAIPRYDTLSLFTYRLAGSYRFPQACASGCILALLTAGIFYLSSIISEKKNGIS